MNIITSKISINRELCKGCALCVDACPHNLISINSNEINSKGYQPAIFNDPNDKCTSCALCALMCPDVAITVYIDDKKTGSSKK